MNPIIISTELGDFHMSEQAADAWRWATKLGICDDEPSEIFSILCEQAIITYMNNEGMSVCFDYNDFEAADA